MYMLKEQELLKTILFQNQRLNEMLFQIIFIYKWWRDPINILGIRGVGR
jgi:hypothetical protein